MSLVGKEKKEGFLQRWSRRKILDVKLDEESGFSNLPETEVIGDINNEKEENKSKIRSETERNINEQKLEIQSISNKIDTNKELIEQKQKALIDKEKVLSQKKNEIQHELKSLEENKKEISLELEKISGLSI